MTAIPKKVFAFQQSSNGVLDIGMYGTLYGDWFKGSEEDCFASAIRSCASTDKIVVHINSEGGDMFAGIAIYNLLSSHPGEVECVVEGLAASSASIVAMAGKTTMRSGAMMMIHNPWAMVAGDADAMRAAAEMLDKSKDALVDIYQEKTGKSLDELKALLAAETWMTAAEAVDAGFADEEADDDDDDAMDVVALNKRRVSVNNVAFQRSRVPAQILAMARPIDHPKEENGMKTILAALSLKDTTNEAEALSVVNRINGERVQLLNITGKDSIIEALAVLSAWKESAGEVVTLRAAATKAQAEREGADFDAEIQAAKKSSVLASSDEHKRNKHALSYKGKPDALVSLRSYLGALDPLVVAANSRPVATDEPRLTTGGVTVLTTEEKRIADKFNIPHERVLKNKARLALKAATVVEVETDDDKDAA